MLNFPRIRTITFAALGVPIQVEETPMSPAYLLIGAAFNAFCSATIAVYLTLKRETKKRKTEVGLITFLQPKAKALNSSNLI